MTRRIGAAFTRLQRRVVSRRPRQFRARSAGKRDEGSLLPAARAKLRELRLELPSPFSAEALCAQVSERRGRQIVIQQIDTLAPEAPCGLWLETADADHFLVARGATQSHRDHIVVHELAHVLYDHQGVLGEPFLHLSLPNLEPALIKRMLGRGSYQPHEEQEAEVLASVIMEQVEREQEGRAHGHDREVLANLSDMFE